MSVSRKSRRLAALRILPLVAGSILISTSLYLMNGVDFLSGARFGDDGMKWDIDSPWKENKKGSVLGTTMQQEILLKNNSRISTTTKMITYPTKEIMGFDHYQNGFFLGYEGGFQLAEMDDSEAEFIGQDAFSASWWQSRERFLRYEQVEEKSPSPEGASFEVIEINEDNMRITRDWLDLNVEHMSKWFRGILDEHDNQDKEGSLKRIIEIFRDYIHSEDRLSMWKQLENPSNKDWLEVSQSTIAVIAYMPYKGYGGAEVTLWSLAATMMSLAQFGVGRIIVSGKDSPEKETVVFEAWNLVSAATQTWHSPTGITSTFQYCNCGNATSDWGPKDENLNIPKTALRRLRHVLLRQEHNEIRRCWAGPTSSDENGDMMDRWKYFYLGEPDLILNARPSSLSKLGKALQLGGVLAPHRLQPTPHESDFQDSIKDGVDRIPFLLPNWPPLLDNVTELDHYEEGAFSCCDAGNHKPYKDFKPCITWWWECGFSAYQWYESDYGREAFEALNKTTISTMHKRLAAYPVMRLKRGTGVVFTGSESGRMCRPLNGVCTRRNQGA